MTAYAFPDRDSPDPRVHVRSDRQRLVTRWYDDRDVYRSLSLCGPVVLEDHNAPEPDGVVVRLCKRCERMAAKREAVTS